MSANTWFVNGRLITQNRRHFIRLATTGLAGCGLTWSLRLLGQQPAKWNPNSPLVNPARKLKVQPVLMYNLPVQREESSWKSWGGVQTAEQVQEEATRIEVELESLRGGAEFPLEISPLAKVTTAEDAARLKDMGQDVTLVYACTGSGERLRACMSASPDALIFVRHRSGPV